MPKNAGLMSTIGAYHRGVYIKGLLGTADGIYSTVVHPIKTVEGLTDIIVNPGMLVKAVKNYTNEKIIHGSSEDRAEFVGHAAFEIGLAVVTNGYAKSGKGAKKASESSKAADIADDVGDISKGSKAASKISGIGDEIAGGSNIKQPSKIVYSSKAAEIGEQAGDIAGIDKKVSLIKQPSEITKPNKAPIELPGNNKSLIEIPESKNPTKLPDITDPPKMPEPKKQVDKVDDIAKEKSLSKEDVKHEDNKEVGKASGSASDTPNSSIKLIKENNTTKFYINFKKKELRVPKLFRKNLPGQIESKLKSEKIGDVVEGEFAKWMTENTSEVPEAFAAKVKNPKGEEIGEIDYLTDKRFYEVKNTSADVDVKEYKQLDKYAKYENENYLNIGDKEVVLFIKERIEDPTFIENINERYKGTIKVINGFDELKEFFK